MSKFNVRNEKAYELTYCIEYIIVRSEAGVDRELQPPRQQRRQEPLLRQAVQVQGGEKICIKGVTESM